MGVTSYLHKETEYIPWSAALDSMGYISKMLKRTAAYGEFKRYMKSLVGPLVRRVGIEQKDGDQGPKLQNFNLPKLTGLLI